MFLNSLSVLFIISIISVRTVSSYDDDVDEKTKIELDANNFGTSSALERSVVLSHTHTHADEILTSSGDSLLLGTILTHILTCSTNNINQHTKQFMHPGVDIVGISCRALTR